MSLQWYIGLSVQLVYRNHCTDLSPQQYTEMSMHGLSPQQWTGLSLTDRFSSVSPVTKQMLCLFYSVEAVLSSYKYQMINSIIWLYQDWKSPAPIIWFGDESVA